MANDLKNKFTGLFKGWFSGGKKESSPPPRAVAAAAPSALASTVVPKPPTPPAPPVPIAPPPTPVIEDANEIHLPLQPVLANLPMDLRARVVQSPSAAAALTVSLETVLTQLAYGAVKITFGELRQAAPELFTRAMDFDQKEIALPLNEILSRINPSLLTRRGTQKRVQVSEEINSPFGQQGQGITISKNAKPAAPAAPARAATPAAAPSPAPAATPAFTPRWSKPAGTPAPANGNAPVAPPAPAPSIKFSPTPPSSAPLPVNSIGDAPAVEQPSILAPLSALSVSWPDALKLEIVQQNLSDAQAALPVPLIEPALKRGRVTFPWRSIRSWIKPTPPPVSIHDAVELELPLNIIAPMFFTKQKATTAQRKVSVNEEIPNLFFGFPQPGVAPVETVTPPTPVAVPVPPPPKRTAVGAALPSVDTNFFTRHAMPPAGVSDTEFQRKGGMDSIGEPATPQEIVGRAISLPGVAGVVIALPDGLKVASHVPAELNADTLAAFLPQLFGRVSQCSAQLRMGDLNNLNFTVGNVPWKIFRVNAVYFAAFGRAGETLPTAHLASLATELDHKRK